MQIKLCTEWKYLVCCCSLPVWRRSSLKKGSPSDLIWPRPGSAPARVWPKNNNTCKGHRVLHPYQVSSKSSGSGEEVENVNCLTDDRQTTDGRRTTDAGQRVITIGHWSLRLLCPKKGIVALNFCNILNNKCNQSETSMLRYDSTTW